MSGDPERSPLRKSPTNLTISFAADTLGWRMPMTLTAELVAGQNAPLHVPHLPTQSPSAPGARVLRLWVRQLGPPTARSTTPTVLFS